MRSETKRKNTTRSAGASETWQKKIGFCTAKSDLAKSLNRGRPTIDRWIMAAIRGSQDFAKCQLLMWEKFGDRAPLHPFQVAVLRDINNFQARTTNNPRANKTTKSIITFIRSQRYSIESYRQ